MTRIPIYAASAIAVTLAIFFAGYFLGQRSVHYETRPGTTRVYSATVTPTPVPLSGRPDQTFQQ